MTTQLEQLEHDYAAAIEERADLEEALAVVEELGLDGQDFVAYVNQLEAEGHEPTVAVRYIAGQCGKAVDCEHHHIRGFLRDYIAATTEQAERLQRRIAEAGGKA